MFSVCCMPDQTCACAWSPLSPVNQHGELGKQDRPVQACMQHVRARISKCVTRTRWCVRGMRRPRRSATTVVPASRDSAGMAAYLTALFPSFHPDRPESKGPRACMGTHATDHECKQQTRRSVRSGPVARRPDATAVPVVGPTYGPGQHVSSARPPFLQFPFRRGGGRRENSPACVCSACTDGCM